MLHSFLRIANPCGTLFPCDRVCFNCQQIISNESCYHACKRGNQTGHSLFPGSSPKIRAGRKAQRLEPIPNSASFSGQSIEAALCNPFEVRPIKASARTQPPRICAGHPHEIWDVTPWTEPFELKTSLLILQGSLNTMVAAAVTKNSA